MSASKFEDDYPWPVGVGNTSLDAISNHLRDTGLHYTRRALELYSAWDDYHLLDAAIAIGTSVELLAKAMLADVAPTLLLDRQDDVRSVMLLSGVRHPNGDRLDALQVRSVSAQQAIDRLRGLRLLGGWSEDDKSVFLVRNAATHMGLVSPEAVQEAIIPMVRFSNHAREYFGQESEWWWGADSLDIASRMLADAEKRLTLHIGAKFSTARQVLARRRQELPLDLQDTILGSLANTSPSMRMKHSERFPCPVCGYQGWAIGFDLNDGRWEDDSLDATEHVNRVSVEAFQCHVCGLILDGWEEVAEAGLDETVECRDALLCKVGRRFPD